MKIMKNLSGPASSNRLYLSPAIFLIMILLLSSCSGRKKSFNILEFSGEEMVLNYSRSLFSTWSVSDSINPTAIVASDGDLIGYSDNRFLLYEEGSGQNKYTIRTDKNISFINEKVNSVTIPNNEDMLPWFKEMKSKDLSGLDFLYFNREIHENYIPLLTELAGIKPDISLGYGGDLADIEKMLKIFKPEFIIGGDLTQEDFQRLSGLSSLKILAISLSDSIYTTPLPEMSQLKQLIIGMNKKNPLKEADFLINNKQIEKLTVFDATRFNFSLIDKLDNLKELIIKGVDTIDNINLITNYKNLELLSLNGEMLKSNEILKGLSHVRWAIFDETVNQNEFDSFLGDHPGLEIVDITNNRKISTLQQLLKLQGLYGLTVSDTISDLATVKSLKTLKYLSVPSYVLKDSTIKSDLKNALPATTIVANEGICLGSGWLLLVFPIILILRIFTERRSLTINK